MDKLVEREHAPRNPLAAAPALAVQFFLIPLVVVGITVLVYVGFRSMLTDERTPAEYLAEVRYGGWSRQWPAAYELSRLMEDPKVRADRSLVPDLVKAFDEAREGDPRIRRYLALAIGRLEPPLPQERILPSSSNASLRVCAAPAMLRLSCSTAACLVAMLSAKCSRTFVSASITSLTGHRPERIPDPL